MAAPQRLESNCRMQGHVVPDDILGTLQETPFEPSRFHDLQNKLENTGYLFFRGVIPENNIHQARREIFQRLHEVGEIKQPVEEGLFTGTSDRTARMPDLGSFWKSVSEGPALRRVSHGNQIQRVLDTVFSETARAHDYLFLRPSVPGRSTHLHYDHPFFARGSQRIHTVWTALGDIPLMEGPLVVMEGSNQFDDLIAMAQGVDYDSKDTPLVQLMDDPAELARQRGVRMLTADFRAGDVLLFSMRLLHGTLDNQSPIGRTRLSCDVRWQPASDPVDPRYSGPEPTGTTGIGYAELNGAKPLNESWHQR